VEEVRNESKLSQTDLEALLKGETSSVNETLVADVSIIGYKDGRGILTKPRTPIRAGAYLCRAKGDTISGVLGLNERPEKGAYIGLLYDYDLPVYVDINVMVQKHVSILAKTGGGKSYLVGVLIEEMIKHGVTCVVLDPHGEYGSLRKPARPAKGMERFNISPKDYSPYVKVFSPDQSVNPGTLPLRFSIANMSAHEILALTGGRSQKRSLVPLARVLEFLKEHRKDRAWGIDDIITILASDEETAKLPLLQELYYIKEMGFITEKGTPVSDLIEKGKTTIINLKGSPPEVQAIIVNRIASALFELRKRNRIPPLLLVVEESHNFAPQFEEVASSKIMRTIASEGRKFGLGLVVVSQRAAKVDKNVLSQCNTQFILRITNPNDLAAIEKSVEGITKGTINQIQGLPVGVALVSTVSLPMPILVEVRPRETMHGGESVTVV
jgi:DNA helicase HerA-like ATPase